MTPWSQSKIVQGCDKQVTDPELCEVGPGSGPKNRRSLLKSLLHPMNAMGQDSCSANQYGA